MTNITVHLKDPGMHPTTVELDEHNIIDSLNGSAVAEEYTYATFSKKMQVGTRHWSISRGLGCKWEQRSLRWLDSDNYGSRVGPVGGGVDYSEEIYRAFSDEAGML